MLYRVDYMLAVVTTGVLIGLLSSSATRGLNPTILGKRYYQSVAMLVILRVGASIPAVLLDRTTPWDVVGHLAGDLLGFLFGALFGLSVLREDGQELLTNPAVLQALSLAVAFTFAFSGIAKAFSIDQMSKFFSTSGYSVTFLKFIITAEILGALGLLVRWTAVPALLGLSVDMFGAVVTHVHNGDPLNDSTGAIGLLLRLAALGYLWELRRRTGNSPFAARKSLIVTAAVAAACLTVAILGSITMHHLSIGESRHV
jgi:hypothetical protein